MSPARPSDRAENGGMSLGTRAPCINFSFLRSGTSARLGHVGRRLAPPGAPPAPSAFRVDARVSLVYVYMIIVALLYVGSVV